MFLRSSLSPSISSAPSLSHSLPPVLLLTLSLPLSPSLSLPLSPALSRSPPHSLSPPSLTLFLPPPSPSPVWNKCLECRWGGGKERGESERERDFSSVFFLERRRLKIRKKSKQTIFNKLMLNMKVVFVSILDCRGREITISSRTEQNGEDGKIEIVLTASVSSHSIKGPKI